MGLFIQGNTKITQNNGRVDGGAVPDRQLDANSGNTIANDVVTGAITQINSDLSDAVTTLNNVGLGVALTSVSGANKTQQVAVDLTPYRFITVSHWYLNQNCNFAITLPKEVFINANAIDVFQGDSRGTVNATSNNGFTVVTTANMDDNWSIKVFGAK